MLDGVISEDSHPSTSASLLPLPTTIPSSIATEKDIADDLFNFDFGDNSIDPKQSDDVPLPGTPKVMSADLAAQSPINAITDFYSPEISRTIKPFKPQKAKTIFDSSDEDVPPLPSIVVAPPVGMVRDSASSSQASSAVPESRGKKLRTYGKKSQMRANSERC